MHKFIVKPLIGLIALIHALDQAQPWQNSFDKAMRTNRVKFDSVLVRVFNANKRANILRLPRVLNYQIVDINCTRHTKYFTCIRISNPGVKGRGCYLTEFGLLMHYPFYEAFTLFRAKIYYLLHFTLKYVPFSLHFIRENNAYPNA